MFLSLVSLFPSWLLIITVSIPIGADRALDSIGSPALWIGFSVFVVALLILDLTVFHRHAHVVRTKEALIWTCVWISLALLFNVYVWMEFGQQRGLEFLTGYVIEKSLSVDNLFVFMAIFSFFSVPVIYQHTVLFWGILGAIILRAIFILVGAAVLHHFHWVIFIFGVFLIFTGIKLLKKQESGVKPEKNPIVKLVRRVVPLTATYEGSRFFIMKEGRRYATLLFLVLVVVETTDVVFAVDSIPAIFAITDDPFIVYTSNIFAILGLRALYFLVADSLNRFRYLHYGIALVLVFVGVKMLISDWFVIPILWSLAVVGLLLGLSLVSSTIIPRKEPSET